MNHSPQLARDDHWFRIHKASRNGDVVKALPNFWFRIRASLQRCRPGRTWTGPFRGCHALSRSLAQAAPWRSGPSGPRKARKMRRGFSPGVFRCITLLWCHIRASLHRLRNDSGSNESWEGHEFTRAAKSSKMRRRFSAWGKLRVLAPTFPQVLLRRHPSLITIRPLSGCDFSGCHFLSLSLARATPWRSGPSGPRKACKRNGGFSPPACVHAIATLLLLILPTLAFAQTYRVAGTITSTEGHPLSHARVTLQNQRTRKPLQSVLTADDGRFEFTNVPAGKYPLIGAKRGYITAAYNQHEQFSTAIVTGAAGVDTEHLTLRIAPLAEISGQVLDEHGDPIRNARVTLWQDDHSTGVSRTRRFGNDNTDDLGSFEFSTLPPGTYFLSVAADPWYAIHPTANAVDVDRSLDVVYPTTYYSGATESEDATPILLRGGDRLQLDLHMLPVPALHVLFHTPPGQDSFPTPQLFKHIFDDIDIPQTQSGQMVSPGIFEIITAPGRFRVSTPATTNSPARTADIDIAQDNQDLDASTGDPLASFTATAEIQGESQLPQPLFISLRDAKGHRASTQVADPDTGATFSELRPGRYTLSAFSNNQPYAISSVTPIGPGKARGKTTPGNAIDLPAAATLNFSVSLIGGSSTVEGFVQQSGKPFAGAMVVLVPANPDAHLEFFRRDQSDLDGSFALPNVVPGVYTAVAIEDGWDLDWSKPNVIARYAKTGHKITIPPITKTIHLPTPIELQPK